MSELHSKPFWVDPILFIATTGCGFTGEVLLSTSLSHWYVCLGCIWGYRTDPILNFWSTSDSTLCGCKIYMDNSESDWCKCPGCNLGNLVSPISSTLDYVL